MQDDPRYDDVVDDVKAFLEERLALAVAAGIAEEQLWLDPGIGFGKTVDHNLELLGRLDELVALGRPDRRRDVAQGVPRPDQRRGDRATGCPGRSPRTSSRSSDGAEVFRVHDVAAGRPGAGRGCCYVPRPVERRDDDIDDIDDDVDEEPSTTPTTRTTTSPTRRSRSRSAASRSTPTTASRAAEREVGQRLVLDITLDVGETDATVTDDVEPTPSTTARSASSPRCRPAALLPDARAPVHGDRRPAAGRLRRRAR